MMGVTMVGEDAVVTDQSHIPVHPIPRVAMGIHPVRTSIDRTTAHASSCDPVKKDITYT